MSTQHLCAFQHACRPVWQHFSRPCMCLRRLLLCCLLCGPLLVLPHCTTVGRASLLCWLAGGALGRARDFLQSQQPAGQLTSSPVSVTHPRKGPGWWGSTLSPEEGVLPMLCMHPSTTPAPAALTCQDNSTTKPQQQVSGQGRCMHRTCACAHLRPVCVRPVLPACACNREPCAHLLSTEVAATAAAGAPASAAAAAGVQQHQHDGAAPHAPAAHVAASSWRRPQLGPPQHDTPVHRG